MTQLISYNDPRTSVPERKDPAQQLPKELFLKALSELDPKDLKNCSLVCKGWNQLLNDRVMLMLRLGYNIFGKVERPLVIVQTGTDITFRLPITQLSNEDLKKQVSVKKSHPSKLSLAPMRSLLTLCSALMIVAFTFSLESDAESLYPALLFLFQSCYKSRALVAIFDDARSLFSSKSNDPMSDKTSHKMELFLLGIFFLFEQGIKKNIELKRL